jgi:hypothetical protein
MKPARALAKVAMDEQWMNTIVLPHPLQQRVRQVSSDQCIYINAMRQCPTAR